jgi:asparagine synthetase B (glutamine-hydrolysing)
VRGLLRNLLFCEYTAHHQLIPVARFPYLDEDVVAFLEEIPLHLKCNLNLPQGDGDKLILRRVARMIGVDECSTLVKRAIQFGSRIAKVSDKNRFGSQRRASGGAKHVCK